jgi:hypothetical protein
MHRESGSQEGRDDVPHRTGTTNHRTDIGIPPPPTTDAVIRNLRLQRLYIESDR